MQVNKELNEQEAESFTGLKRYDDKGNEIEYRVKETFTSEFYQQKNDAIVNKDENGNIKIEFTNEFKLPENNTRKITIKKIWQDTKEQMSKRPIDITATITGGKYVNKDIKISGEIDKWQKEIEVRNYDDNGDKIEYIIGEKELNKYYKLSKIEQPTAQNDSKNITFKVTSGELLKLTNGIVQGMSGSPIIQNGKIIGAVTHVFVDDSTCGYGIFIDRMLDKD